MLVADPESTRMPARAAFVVLGAATVLLRMWASMVAVDVPRARTKMPGPSVPLMLLPLIVITTCASSVVVVAESASAPTAIPAEPTALLATMTLFEMVALRSVLPSACTSITTPSMFVIGFAAVPLLEMLKFIWPRPATPAVINRSG